MKHGDMVYDTRGARYEYLMEIPGEGHVVRKTWVEDDEPYYEEPTTLRRVFAEPPIQHVNAELDAAQTKLAAVMGQIADTEAELRGLKHDLPKRLDALRSRSAMVKRLEDFLDGKITHMVVKPEYGTYLMGTIEEVTKAGDSYDHGKWKLVSLMGNSKGDLEYMLHRYSSGGDGVTVIPCTSEAEAMGELQRVIDAKIEAVRAMSNRPLGSLGREMTAADKYGLDFPDDARAAIRDEKIKGAKSTVVSREDALAKAKAALSAIEGEDQ